MAVFLVKRGADAIIALLRKELLRIPPAVAKPAILETDEMPPYLRVLISCILLAIVALGACTAPRRAAAPASQPVARPAGTATPPPATDEEAIRQLVVLEGQDVVSQDIEGLMDLWAVDATVTDAKNTPADTTDDARWSGTDAIRDRYVVLVFPGAPATAGDPAVKITIEGDKATAAGTTTIGSEVSPGGDRWTFVRRDGRWWIESLTYNLEAK
jgi:hypothetical protein